MIRVACLLGLIALAVLITVSVRLDGATATIFSFVGIPALVAAMGLYVVQRWRAGAFHSTGHSRPSSS
jgi:Flp pilus assembly pilin Flp